MVKEGLALEVLPWEAKALDGLELPASLAVGYRERQAVRNVK
jgi:hypothetical protein